MHQTTEHTTGGTGTRRGFALIVTLSVLTVIIALTGVLVGYLDSARRDAGKTKALLQANVYFADFKNFIGKFPDKKALYAILYTTTIPIQSENGEFSMLVSCKPLDSGVNINWLGASENTAMASQYETAQRIFESLVTAYAIQDPVKLEEMILEEIGQGETEESDARRLRQKNGIISYRQFVRVLDRYRFETDDKNIVKIPWKKYFVFIPVSKVPEDNRIEGDYLSAELIAALFDLDAASVKESWIPAEGALSSLLNQYGKSKDKRLFTSGFADRSECEVRFMYEDERYRFSFSDSKGEVNGFEFHGKE